MNLALGRLKKEGCHEFKAIVDDIARPCIKAPKHTATKQSTQKHSICYPVKKKKWNRHPRKMTIKAEPWVTQVLEFTRI